MYKLQKLNVVKIVSSEKERNILLDKGFVEIQVPYLNKEDTKSIQDITETDFNNMKKAELLKIAQENNIEVNEKMIRKDLIRKIKESTKK